MIINTCTVILLVIHGVEGLTLKQSPKFWVKQPRKTVTFECEVTDLGSNNYVHWYQKRDGETFKRLLYISASGTTTSESKEFVAQRQGHSYNIILKAIKKEHAGVYYCASWDGDKKVFGSGTRLYVTGQAVKTPSVRTYPPSDKDGKTTMVCQASDMFPDLVKFTWQRKSSTEDWTNVADKLVVEQRDEKPEVTVTSMVIVDKGTAQNNNYRCSVTHDDKPPITTLITKDVSSSAVKPNDTPQPTCPPSKESPNKQISGTLDETHSLYLFVYAYGIMLMKNAVYFGAVSIYLLKRKAGEKKDETS